MCARVRPPILAILLRLTTIKSIDKTKRSSPTTPSDIFLVKAKGEATDFEIGVQNVNNKWSELGKAPVGISKEEFSIFVPTLINFAQINDQAIKLINLRVMCENKTLREKNLIR